MSKLQTVSNYCITALETFVMMRYINLHLPYHTIVTNEMPFNQKQTVDAFLLWCAWTWSDDLDVRC